MKKLTTTILVLVFIALATVSCKDVKKEKPQNKETQTEIKHTEKAKHYDCPMKCEGDKTYDKPRGCPICGMDLTEVKKDNHEGHNH